MNLNSFDEPKRNKYTPYASDPGPQGTDAERPCLFVLFGMLVAVLAVIGAML